jgi:hypothetical protein
MSDLLGLAIDVILCLYEKRRHYGFFQFSLYVAVILRHTHRDISGLLQRVSIRGIDLEAARCPQQFQQTDGQNSQTLFY